MNNPRKYADAVMQWLSDEGYTHCFFVAGGNSMHLLDGARRTMICVPFVHEVSAGIAAEYFNEVQQTKRAFILVTAGPGLTNCLTALAGAFLESRDLLVLGGQVKTSDLATNGLRQRGIQEIDGVALAAPVAKLVRRIENPIGRNEFVRMIRLGRRDRRGPVFLEICLDVQGAPFDEFEESVETHESGDVADQLDQCLQVRDWLAASSRPVLLLGGGVSREVMPALLPLIDRIGLPVMTTWNGADRVGVENPQYFGRPNTWGQRSSNVLIQQSDLIIAAGTRLGLQQTGFNWEAFGPEAKVVQIDIDELELTKGHPRVDLAIVGDVNILLNELLKDVTVNCSEWVSFCRQVTSMLPNDETSNSSYVGYVNPYSFVSELSKLCRHDDVVIPCSSGGAFTVMMQAFENKTGQRMITNKGLASMGYGLAGAIGASLATDGRRTVLVEGDGGFSQNLQELATVVVNNLPLKIFVFSNEGYASIRMTQRNYFGGQYLGCDTETGLGFPDWELLARAYGLPYYEITTLDDLGDDFLGRWNSSTAAFFVVKIHPEQTYFPKISSRVTETGGMESAPLHQMSPDLDAQTSAFVFQHIP